MSELETHRTCSFCGKLAQIGRCIENSPKRDVTICYACVGKASKVVQCTCRGGVVPIEGKHDPLCLVSLEEKGIT